MSEDRYTPKYDCVHGSSDLAENCVFDRKTGETVISRHELRERGLSTFDLIWSHPSDQALDAFVEKFLAD